MTADDRRALRQDRRIGKFIERRQHGAHRQSGFALQVSEPSPYSSAAEQRRRADRRRDRHAIAQALAQHDEVGLEAIRLEREQIAGAAEVRLHFVEDEDDVVLAAKRLQHLQVRLGRMIRAAAAEVGLRDQRAELAAELLP